MYTITLADGTILDNLELNGNNYISNEVIDSSVFENNLTTILISNDETVNVYDNMFLVSNRVEDNRSWFILSDKSEKQEKEDFQNEFNQRLQSTLNILLTGKETNPENTTQLALEIRKALQFFINTLDIDAQREQILEIPSLFPPYVIGKKYHTHDIFSYGLNEKSDPQLYQVLQDHTSAAEWPPDTTASLYKVIDTSENGYPEWSQPLGATDAYKKGDIVSYKGTLYRSIIDGNVWSPDSYPDGWEIYE